MAPFMAKILLENTDLYIKMLSTTHKGISFHRTSDASLAVWVRNGKELEDITKILRSNFVLLLILKTHLLHG